MMHSKRTPRALPLTLLVLFAAIATALGQPPGGVGPVTLTIQPTVPLAPNLLYPQLPNPPASIWTWNYAHLNSNQVSPAPTILQSLFQEEAPNAQGKNPLSLLSKTQWGIAPPVGGAGVPVILSSFQQPQDVVLNAEGRDLIITNLTQWRNIRFGTTPLAPGAQDIERMTITHDGNVGIGINNPWAELHIASSLTRAALFISVPNQARPALSVYANGDGWVGIGTYWSVEQADTKLAVNGKIRAKEVLITMNDWPDYVFSDQYPLMPLAELEAHLKTERHLPGIPSAADVMRDGALVGETQKKLLEKIEELTLYIIDQNKKIECQDRRLHELEEKLRNDNH